jgi:hypothetical protein
LAGVSQDTLDLIPERLKSVFTPFKMMTSLRLTHLKITKPLREGETCISIEDGKLRMSQTKTAENFLSVTVDIATSTP